MVTVLTDEAAFVERSFRSNFSADEKLVIYGLGRNTKTILERCPEYNIVGLMDRTRTGGSEWGLPILSMDEAHKSGVKKIVIIASSANVPIIYRRIEDLSEQYKIKVYDINGVQKAPSGEEYRIAPFYASCTAEDLIKKIDAADIISFDIFDTLLVRDVLYPTDIFEIVEHKHKECIPEGIHFAEIRASCERKLYYTGNPTIFEIYAEIQSETGMDEELIRRLLDSEIEEERGSLKPRRPMTDMVDHALSSGKKVCCTSDMYLTSEILSDILKKAGYKSFDNLFISCEYGVSKNHGLFDVVKRAYPGKRVLHVGDNYDADISSAMRYGIADTFRLPSIYRMINDGTVRNILAHDADLSDRCEIGRLFVDQFNDPFTFATTKGKCVIIDNFSLGFYFIEPLLASFVEWMLSSCKKDNIDMIFLGARDGFLIQKMLGIREKFKETSVRSKYLYVSRTACTGAGLKTEDDVRYVFTMAFDGPPEQQLARRFALDGSEILDRRNTETDAQFLERHIPLILEKSKTYRKKYRLYLKKNIDGVNKAGFFDFVSSGTCQLWLENIWPEAKWTGYYFLKVFEPYKDRLDIRSYFSPKYAYEKQSKLITNKMLMENILSSFEPTLRGFTEDGRALFDRESRDDAQLERLSEVHKGILAAYERRLANRRTVASRELADKILDIMKSNFSVMSADFFEGNVLDDPFANRDFDLKKMVSL